MNVLVGPNNCGKSTLLGAFRTLEAGLRKARSRNPELVRTPRGQTLGYQLTQEILPISVENIHTDYAESNTTVSFGLSNENRLVLYFPSEGGCILIPEPKGRNITNTSTFKAAYPIHISAVPVLGPIEQEEEVLKLETIQRDAGTHRASRHFRNFWHHFPEGFEEFAALVAKTWPGMEIEKPERSGVSSRLAMFCKEARMTRELFWSGSGFQIWCQLLTHVSRAQGSSLLIVDEPEVYLHPDVQRQLLDILRSIGPDILLATHSSEVIGDADPSEIAVIDKGKRSAERLRDINGIQFALSSIGSIHNIALTRLARNRRVLFVEGEHDFKILRSFAKVLGLADLATGRDITPVPSEGFSSWERLSSLGWGIEKALGQHLSIAAVYDRDYWPDEEVTERLTKLRKSIQFAHVLERKEIENYLLVPSAIERALKAALSERGGARTTVQIDVESISALLDRLTDVLKTEVQGQCIAKRLDFLRRTKSDTATVATEALAAFDDKWKHLPTRLNIVPGKTVLHKLREEIQTSHGVTLTDYRILTAFRRSEVPQDMIELLKDLDTFRNKAPENI